MKRYYEIIEQLKLQEEFAVYLMSSSINAPYHNLWHTISMIEDCYDGYVHETGSDFGCKNLIIAAIFHDIDHSQGKYSDDVNIKVALARVDELPYNTEEIKDIIRATQYPYVIPADELSLEQKIIRDADLMSSFKLTLLPHCLVGLSEELNIDLVKMFDGQERFIENSEFNTQWGRNNFNKYINDERKEMSFLKTLKIED